MAGKTALDITVKKPTPKELEDLHVFSWPIWTKEPSTFHWVYDDEEICYFLEGEVTVITKTRETHFGKGDLVIFPKGLECVWNIKSPVKKHYQFR